MKILHITNSYAPVGGAEEYLYNLCSELEKRGHENLIIYSNKNVMTWPDDFRKNFFIDNITNAEYNQDNINKALSIIKRENPDIVYLHIIKNAKLITNIINIKPVVQYVHNHDLYCPAGFMHTRFLKCRGKFSFLCLIYCLFGNCIGCNPFNAIKQFNATRMYIKAAKKLNAMIVASKFMKQQLINSNFEANKIYVISYFVYPKQKYQEQQQGDRPCMLFIGRICKSKGPDYLINALPRLNYPHKLIIIGDGYYLGYIKKLTQNRKVNENVEFTGWLERAELEDYYKRAALVVLPSIWPEPFGIVGIEAMSYAKPVVAFDVGGVREWLEDGKNGFLVKTKDIDKLSEKINTLLKDKRLREELGSNGKAIAEEKFSPQKHLDSLLNLFSDIT